MDIFAEQLIKKIPSKEDKIKKITILSGSVVLCGILIATAWAISFYYLFFALALCIGVIIAAIFLINNMNIEYEYSVTNGEFDIDKIISQKSRKSFLSVKVSEFTEYGRYNDLVAEPDENLTFILACDGTGKGYWYADFRSGKYGKSRLIFSPDEKIRNAIKPYLSPTLKMKAIQDEYKD